MPVDKKPVAHSADNSLLGQVVREVRYAAGSYFSPLRAVARDTSEALKPLQHRSIAASVAQGAARSAVKAD